MVSGFSDDFVKSEGYLCVHDEQGRLLLDSTGCPVLECMCGNVLRGRADPTLPFFTPGGSFWTNSTTDLLASTTEAERQARTCNRCHGEGYESVALIPLRSGDDVIGLLQLCDHERNRFTRETIEFLEGMGASIGVALARIQADETLANSEAKFRALYETTPDAVMLLDAEGFLDCNPSTLRVFGCESREEFLGKHPSELSPPSQPGGRDSRSAADEHIARALTEGTDHFEWLHQRVDGSPFPADVLLSRLELGRAPVLQAVVRDITDRKRMEQRQARTVALLRAVLEAVDDLMLTDSVDALCRRAVELARERLGLERCSIYVVEGDDLRGTYGTSLEGQTTAEHDVLLPGAAGTVSRHNLPPGAQWWTVEHAARTTQVDGQMVELEPGWVAWTQIPTAQGVAGVLFNDAAVSGAPPDDVQQDVVAVYCSLLVGLIEMKRIGEELRTSEERLRAMVETSPDGIVLVDPETLGFLEFNEAACRQLGYAPGGLDGLRVTDIDVAQSAAQVRANAARLAGGERLGFETKQRTQSGEVRDVWVVARQLWFGERPVIFAVFRDITDQRRSEQEQVRLLALNQATVDTVPSALLVLDEGLNVLMTNRPCSTIQGAGQADPVDRNLLDLFPPELLQTQGLLGRIQAVAAGGPPDELLALPHESPSDPPQYLDIRLSGFEVADEEGHPQRRVLVAIDDVTHQRTLEEQIGQMSKLEAIGTLAGGVAHDFSNILTGILGYADIIAQEGLAPSAQQEIGVIRELSQRAAGLTRQLLAFSRRQPLQTRTVDLNDLIAELTRMLARLIGEHVTQVLSLAPDLVTVRADPGQIEQVIMNLAVNARDAMPDGGTLTIETANAVLDEAYAATHAGVTPGEYALVAVSDTGKGMDEATCARIFEPFFTTKGVGEGTGLGLATVYGIVKQHGGNIWVYSEPGCGTTFKIYLPLAGNEAEVAAQPAPPPEASRGEETILLVEDDPSVLEIAQRALESHGYRVLVVADPAQAEGVLDAYEGEVALVVTDVVMPNLFGPALVERLQAGRPSLRVLYMSGYTRGAATGNGTLPHDVPFLNKPFTPSVLAAKVREVLGA
jgi:PAS domain S-box-containing protein